MGRVETLGRAGRQKRGRGPQGESGRHHGDMLGTMERCLASVRKQADALGIAVDLTIPINPNLLASDTTILERLTRLLLSYALGHVQPGARLHVRLDVAPDNAVRLAIDEEGDGEPLHGSAGRPTGRKRSAAPTRAIVHAAGGQLSVSEDRAGRVHVTAILPRALENLARETPP